MLTVHHLRRSQSERIVWLCEELGLPYVLKCYDRNKTDMLAPPEYKALHPMGTAPVITGGNLVLGSGWRWRSWRRGARRRRTWRARRSARPTS